MVGRRSSRAEDRPRDPARCDELNRVAGKALLQDDVHEDERRNQEDGAARNGTGAPQGNGHREQAEERTHQEQNDHRDRGRDRDVVDRIRKGLQIEAAVLGEAELERLEALDDRQADQAEAERVPAAYARRGERSLESST